MKINKYILGAAALLCMILPATSAQAQDVRLKCMEWNIKSFEYNDNSNATTFDITEVMDYIKTHNPDIICFNEFETATGRMSSVEKLIESAQALGMFPYFIYSYNKDSGFYGNGILSKYPIVNSESIRLGMHGGSDQRSAGWADILVPTASKPEGVKVRIVCTHLDHLGSDATTRLEQAKEVIAKGIAPAVAESVPVLLLGDMNCGYSSVPIQEYEKTGTRLCDNTSTFGSGSKLDYFISFPKNKWSCSDYTVPKTARLAVISDHYPIIGTAVLQN
ncbi:endonuclease/exonuclease/phosphatase family protein [uncultured Alistipes sp.]|uniref:endonuclease/exonuclease/phosphatase family protein n=1 Tax=uncultured Alistipes sp. TaxID=538949 RepID=UPI0025F2E5EE|nr:endonuclease/exonuclease/phosphatase family protein [uncultured Alistipes sp.]